MRKCSFFHMSTSSADDSASPSPVAPNAPKFGTLIPNRIFVGGISPNTTESELQSVFSNYGRVKATKIILDRAGVSKGYGFVTFETEEEAKRIQKEADIILRERKLNIAPAIKKQPFARGYDSPPVVPSETVMYQNGIPYTYHNGMAFFSVPDSICTYGSPQQANYPVIYPSSVYVPQQPFPCPTAAAGTTAAAATVSSNVQTAPYGSYGNTSLPDLAQYVPVHIPTQYYIPDQNY